MIRKLLLFALILFFVVPGALAQTAPQDDEFALVESARRMRASGNAQFNFQDVDMVKFIRFMAELLNENLVLAPGVKGSISVISPKPFPLKEARQVFISVLEMNGYTLQQGAGFGKVVPLQAGSSAESDVRTGKMGPGEGEQTVSQVVPLDYVTADFIAAAVSQASGRSVSVLPVGRGNDILLTGRATDVNRAIDLIRTLDRADKIFKSRTVKITKASPEIIAAHLANLAKVPGSPVFGLTVLPDAPGSQIVLAGEERHINRALKLIADLDVTPKSGEFHVYRLENADAKVVAEQLSKILSAQASQAATPDGRIPTTVVPDIPSNSLIFAAPPIISSPWWRSSRRSTPCPGRCSSGGLIAEVNLTKLNNAGIDWATWGGSVAGDAVIAGQLNMGGAGVPGTIIDWFQNLSRTEEEYRRDDGTYGTRTNYKGMGLVYAYLDLLKKFDAVNVLSMPRIMCTDNLPSELQVGQVIPQLKGKLSDMSNPNAVQSSYEYKDTGLILNVTPSIRSGNLVALDVEQIVEDVLTAMTAETPVTGKRKIKTSVLVSSGNTVILGGSSRKLRRASGAGFPGSPTSPSSAGSSPGR